jgi:hypothetical protein
VSEKNEDSDKTDNNNNSSRSPQSVAVGITHADRQPNNKQAFVFLCPRATKQKISFHKLLIVHSLPRS